MDYVRTTWVEFFGCKLLNKQAWHPVKSRDLSKLRIPKGAYAFQFRDCITAEVDVDGEKIKLESLDINHSPIFYVKGKLYTLAQIKKKFRDRKDHLIPNMESAYSCGARYFVLNGDDLWNTFDSRDEFVLL